MLTHIALWTFAPLSAASQEAVEEALHPVWVFENAFWPNLHHFLYSQGLAVREGADPALDDPAWVEAVNWYGENLGERDLLFDEELRRTGESLNGIDEELVVPVGFEGIGDQGFVLASVSTLYRERLWPDHRAQNQAFIEELRPRLEEPLYALTDELSRIFAETWPEKPIRVDVFVSANWAGAYTSLDPPHIRIGSGEKEPDGVDRDFEVLLHESAHLIAGPVFRGLAERSREQGMRIPRDLWHAVLFDTVGEIVRHSALTPEDYVPYAKAHGLWKGRWAPSREAILVHWRPHVAGETSLQEALDGLVTQLGKPVPSETGSER
jgi:hypothetical protein